MGAVAGRLGLSRRVTLLIAAQDSGLQAPITWGLFRPVVLLPRPVAEDDDGSEVSSIELAADAQTAALKLGSGHTLTLRVLPGVVRAIINILSHTAISDHAGPLQLSEMTRNTRLAHPENLLQFSDRKFLLFEKQQQPQTCGIGKQPQQING